MQKELTLDVIYGVNEAVNRLNNFLLADKGIF